MKRLIRLYPRPWRERYGEEFAALLEEQPLTPRNLWDLIGGAVDAHLSPQVQVQPRLQGAGGAMMLHTQSRWLERLGWLLMLPTLLYQLVWGLNLVGVGGLSPFPALRSGGVDAVTVDWLMINSARLILAGPAVTLLALLLLRRKAQPSRWLLVTGLVAVGLTLLYSLLERFPLL